MVAELKGRITEAGPYYSPELCACVAIAVMVAAVPVSPID